MIILHIWQVVYSFFVYLISWYSDWVVSLKTAFLAPFYAYIKRQLWDCCQFNRISPLMMTKIVFGSQSIDKQGRTVIENRISINPWLTFHWFPMLLTTVCSSFKDEKNFINEQSTKKYPWLLICCTSCLMLQKKPKKEPW